MTKSIQCFYGNTLGKVIAFPTEKFENKMVIKHPNGNGSVLF